MDPTTLGHILEGRVERDPLTDRLQILTVDSAGRPKTIELEPLLSSYVGKEVRFTLASFDDLDRLAKMVEDHNSGQVGGVMPEEFPGVSFNIARRSPV